MTIRDVHFRMSSRIVNRDWVDSIALEVGVVRLVYSILRLTLFESELTFTKLFCI
jgi:hypothetical protein